ncbi:MAG: restriction endonuclease subunit S [Arcobacteraceae bacterium]|nr:restriction endonuclease subunit S [Arcobacteraceae bacterium]
MKLERYDCYKDSNIELLGKVPNLWEITTIKNIFRYFGSGSTPQSNNIYYYENGVINWLNTSDLKNFLIDSTKFKITNLALREVGLKVYPINTIAVAMYGQGETRGTPALLKIPTTTNQASCMMYKSFIADERYILWWFISKKEALRAVNVGATQPNMNADFIKNLFISLPKKDTQIIISNYLDIKTQKIDKEISILEQKIEKYKELKQTLIAETILRGLNKNIELKDSEIEWIGNIPNHWEVKRLKDFIKFTIGGEVIDVSYWNDGNELTYTAGKNPVLSTFDNFPDRKRTKQNDILIARNGDGFIHVPKLNSIFTNVVQLVRLSKKVDVKFIFYSLENIKYQINKTSNGDFIASLNKDMWFNSFIITPTYEEQVEIANYLDEKTSKIDSIVEVIGKKIEVLKEFRKTLINDVVTGKVKVA